ncbi:three component ABC system middle component [Bacillus cereus]|uniref:Uncharacterized protein n=1 Tax=Bacillus cereus TaxID=1396 RepID=A0A9X6Z7B6_BACCE|nr:three component ABC system middle component [Bacillus cereus]PFB29919.1 hypothetical protein CN388_07070 [Bacillus cereus]PFC10364.1 hypothetical protein CN284_21530 [Bacillus cereus]PFD18218.1 hypothetical protein CN263_23505 [Bacillus cereus]
MNNQIDSYNKSSSRYLYNNELIGSIAIASVLKHLKKATISQCALILPLVSHKDTLNFLKRKNSVVRSMEEFITKKPHFFVNFDQRYVSLLPVSMNSIILLKEIGLVNIENEFIHYIHENKFEYTNETLGKRVEDIIKSSSTLSCLLDDDIANLYLQLRVIL